MTWLLQSKDNIVHIFASQRIIVCTKWKYVSKERQYSSIQLACSQAVLNFF